MPSNKDLIASIKELDAEAETDNVNNAGLVDKLKSLRSDKVDADIKAENEKTMEKADTDSGAAAMKAKHDADIAKAEAPAPELPPYRIADGKAITTKRGILSDGDEIKVEYCSGGKEHLEQLVKAGFVIKA